jgi:hypothetical protein
MMVLAEANESQNGNREDEVARNGINDDYSIAALSESLHISRTFGRDCNYWRARSTVASGSSSRSRGGSPVDLHESASPSWLGYAESRQFAWILSDRRRLPWS